jgi:hypothetical protein
MKLFPASSIIIHDMPITIEPVLIGNKTFKAYGTAGMDLTRAYADFCSEAIPEAIRKSG